MSVVTESRRGTPSRVLVHVSHMYDACMRRFYVYMRRFNSGPLTSLSLMEATRCLCLLNGAQRTLSLLVALSVHQEKRLLIPLHGYSDLLA